MVAMNEIIITMKASTTTQSHWCAVKASHPSRRSASMVEVSSRTRGGMRRRLNSSPATRHEAASTTMPHPGPTVATSAAPATRPNRLTMLYPDALTAFACCNRCLGTVWGNTPWLAGKDIASAPPATRDRPTSMATDPVPVRISAATTAWVTPLTRLDHSRTVERRNRSASTPPNSSRTTSPSERAPTTRPRSVNDPVRSSMAKASAIGATAVPAMSATLAENSRRKLRWAHTVSRPLAGAAVTPDPGRCGRPEARRGRSGHRRGRHHCIRRRGERRRDGLQIDRHHSWRQCAAPLLDQAAHRGGATDRIAPGLARGARAGSRPDTASGEGGIAAGAGLAGRRRTTRVTPTARGAVGVGVPTAGASAIDVRGSRRHASAHRWWDGVISCPCPA